MKTIKKMRAKTMWYLLVDKNQAPEVVTNRLPVGYTEFFLSKSRWTMPNKPCAIASNDAAALFQLSIVLDNEKKNIPHPALNIFLTGKKY